jgi:hypothetical protein
MTTVQAATTGTVLDALLASLQKAADYNRDDTVAPAAVLWPDEKREWERLVPRLRVTLPHFLVFGPYEKSAHTGPAIWLRCVLAGKVPNIDLPPGTVPIIYLPGVSRATLRATEECPPELKRGVTQCFVLVGRPVFTGPPRLVFAHDSVARIGIVSDLTDDELHGDDLQAHSCYWFGASRHPLPPQ